MLMVGIGADASVAVVVGSDYGCGPLLLLLAGVASGGDGKLLTTAAAAVVSS